MTLTNSCPFAIVIVVKQSPEGLIEDSELLYSNGEPSSTGLLKALSRKQSFTIGCPDKVCLGVGTGTAFEL